MSRRLFRSARFLVAFAVLGGLVGTLSLAPVTSGVAQPTAAESPATEDSGAAGEIPISEAEAAEAAAVEETTRTEEALALAEAGTTGEPVIVESKTTETELVEAMPDGSFQLTIDSSPARVERDGEWNPIDPTLEYSEGGDYWSPAMTTVPVRFSGGGDTQLAQVKLRDGTWLTESWPLGDLPIPVVEGASATYADVLPDVDLRLTATTTGMTEVLIIHTPEAAANPELATLPIEVEGASLTATEDGGVQASPLGAEPHEDDITSSAPVAWDSSAEGSNETGPSPEVFTVELDSETSGSTHEIDIESYTEQEGLEYPLFVDPDWTGNRHSAWYIDAAWPDENYQEGFPNSDPAAVGYLNSSYANDGRTHRARAFWHMNTSGVAGKKITAAVFNTSLVWSFNCSEYPVSLFEVTNADNTTSWNTNASYIVGSALSTQWAAGRAGDASCPQRPLGFDLASRIQSKANSNAAGIVLALMADESTSASWKRFSFDVQLIISYNTVPNVPSALSLEYPARACGSQTSPGYVSSNYPMTFRGLLSDADGQNVRPKITFQRWRTSPSPSQWVTASEVGWMEGPYQAGGYHTLRYSNPAPFHDNTLYRWAMSASDGYDESANSGWCYLKIDNTKPKTPTAPMPDGPFVVGQPVNVTVSPVQIDDSPFLYQYYWVPSGASVSVPDPPVDVRVCDRAGLGDSRYACARGMNSVLLVTAPVSEDESTLRIRTVDEAGNASEDWLDLVFTDVAPDPAIFAEDEGHGWLLGPNSASVPSSISDVRTPGLPLNLGAADNFNAAASATVKQTHPIVELEDMVSILEYESYTGQLVESVGDTPGRGHLLVEAVGWAYAPNYSGLPAGTVKLCRSDPGSNDRLTVTPESGNCGTDALVGHIFAAQQSSSTAQIRSCQRALPAGHYVTFAQCKTGETATALGWVKTMDAVANTETPAVDTSESFSVSAYLWPETAAAPGKAQTAVSQFSGANSGFTLGTDSSGNWQFCVSDQAPGATPTCVRSTAAAGDPAWTLVTGVWDKTNQQIRLYTGTGVQPANVVWRAPATFEDGVTSGGFTVGNAQVREGVAERWFGNVSSPVVFPGVVTSDNRLKLQEELVRTNTVSCAAEFESDCVYWE